MTHTHIPRRAVVSMPLRRNKSGVYWLAALLQQSLLRSSQLATTVEGYMRAQATVPMAISLQLQVTVFFSVPIQVCKSHLRVCECVDFFKCSLPPSFPHSLTHSPSPWPHRARSQQTDKREQEEEEEYEFNVFLLLLFSLSLSPSLLFFLLRGLIQI